MMNTVMRIFSCDADGFLTIRMVDDDDCDGNYKYHSPHPLSVEGWAQTSIQLLASRLAPFSVDYLLWLQIIYLIICVCACTCVHIWFLYLRLHLCSVRHKFSCWYLVFIWFFYFNFDPLCIYTFILWDQSRI